MQWVILAIAVGATLSGAFFVGMGTGDTSGYEGTRALVGRAVNHWILGRRFPQPMYQQTTIAGRKMRRTDRQVPSAIATGEHITTFYSWTPEQRFTEGGGRFIVAIGILALLVELAVSPGLAILATVGIFGFHLVYYQVRVAKTLASGRRSERVVGQDPAGTAGLEPAGRARDRFDG